METLPFRLNSIFPASTLGDRKEVPALSNACEPDRGSLVQEWICSGQEEIFRLLGFTGFGKIFPVTADVRVFAWFIMGSPNLLREPVIGNDLRRGSLHPNKTVGLPVLIHPNRCWLLVEDRRPKKADLDLVFEARVEQLSGFGR